jgi:CRISPR/Cas system CSM-associated protein Csm3 (group 7 of RAMP superfamily)
MDRLLRGGEGGPMNGPGDRGDAVPPSYTILSSVGRVEGPPLQERPHDRVDLKRITGSLELRFTTQDPLHMGSGASNFWDFGGRIGEKLARDIVVQCQGGIEAPLIPGSSLKGAVRSIAEALGGGCELRDARCEPPCAICALFGHLMREGGYLGRVGFDDAYPPDPEEAARHIGAVLGPMPFQPRVAKGRRIYGVAPRPIDAPVPYVVVDRGVSFLTRLHLHNVTPPELGLVLLSSGVDGSFRLRIGGGKFANMGRVRTEVTGGTMRRSYARPMPDRLDAAEAAKLAHQGMDAAKQKLSNRAREILKTLEATLGDKS